MTAESGVQRAAVATAQVWHSQFGDMLIETCIDGSVWINGEPVAGKPSAPVVGESPSARAPVLPAHGVQDSPGAEADIRQRTELAERVSGSEPALATPDLGPDPCNRTDIDGRRGPCE